MASAAPKKKIPNKFDTIKNLKEDFLTCGICLEYFTNPKSLVCLHKFCESCLQVYVEKLQTKPAGKFQCPMKCNEHTTLPSGGIKELKTDFIMKGLDEFLSVKESERKIDKRSVKDIFGDNDSVKVVRCLEHEGKICELFCEEEQCNVPVCIKCISSDHNGHKVAEIETLTHNSKQVIDDLIKAVDCEISVTAKKKEIFNDFLNELEETSKELTTSVDTHLEDIIFQMRQKAKQLKEEIKEETKKQSATLEALADDNDKRDQAFVALKTSLTQAQSVLSPKDLIQIKQVSQLKLMQLRNNDHTDRILRSTMIIDNNIDLLSQDLLQLVVRETKVSITSENGEVALEETLVETNDGDGSSDDSVHWEVSSDDEEDDDEY